MGWAGAPFSETAQLLIPTIFTGGVLSFSVLNSGHCRTPLATLTEVPRPCYRHLFALSRADSSGERQP